jgi:hypothetical protein
MAMALPGKNVVRVFKEKPHLPFLSKVSPGKANTTKYSLFLVPIADTARATATTEYEREHISLFLLHTTMQAKLSVALTGKDATKLLEGLTMDPQLWADDDPSVLGEEQFPSEHHTMLQGKTAGSSSDNIITILQWERHHTPHLAEEQNAMLAEQKNKTQKLFQFTATTNIPWNDVQFTFWKHKVTNMVLSAIRLALKIRKTSRRM